MLLGAEFCGHRAEPVQGYQLPVSEKRSHHILHPYYLKEYRNRWYLLAYHDHFREVWVYGLDRVKGLSIVHGKKFIDMGFDISDYFRHHVGITRSGEEPDEILVAFSRLQANYIISQPLHGSQEMVGEEELPRQEALHDRVEEEEDAAGEDQETPQDGLEVDGEAESRLLFRFHLVPTFEFTSQLCLNLRTYYHSTV